MVVFVFSRSVTIPASYITIGSEKGKRAILVGLSVRGEGDADEVDYEGYNDVITRGVLIQ